MKIDYRETTSDLLTRINIHNKFGSMDIDNWMLDLLKLKKEMKILDVACGAGKQCFSFYDSLQGECDITGGDVSSDLLGQALKEGKERNARVKFIDLNFNKIIPFMDNQFDLLSCCFAIYYAENISSTFREMYRVLKPGGKLFTTGPMPENKKLFYDIIRDATDDRPIPPMPGSSRYGSEILTALHAQFPNVEVHIFNNPLTFKTVQPFVDYTRASLSEDRKLWGSFFDDKQDFENIMDNIEQAASKRLARDHKLVMTKVVGGFIATK
jgi:ubiquinone/menaquinone biosynthesis C-methylase UbiE